MLRFLILTIVGVLAYLLAFPPVDFAPAGLAALVAWALAFRRDRLGAAGWWLLYIAGVILFAFGCAWIADLNPMFPWLMAIFEGIALPLFCLMYRFNLRGVGRPIPVWLALPIAWVAVEYLRSVFPLDGFPWLLLGYTLWKAPILIQIADITGVYGLGFLICLGAGVAADWIFNLTEGRRKKIKRPVEGTVIFGLIVAAVLIYGFARPGTLKMEQGPTLAAVQGNLSQKLKDDSGRADVVYSRYLKTTRLLFDKPQEQLPDLVIWPETLFPYPLGEGRTGDRWYQYYGYDDALEAERRLIGEQIVNDLLAPYDAWFLTGVTGCRLGNDGQLEKRNSAFLYDPSGKRRAVYHKTVLVPGGEYLPFIEFLPFREWLETTVREGAGFLPDLKPGDGPRVMQMTAAGRTYSFGVQICYENIYGDYCRRFIRDGADFLINISNEGWFTSASEFDQMLAMSVFRAVETRRTLFRSTNTGISCLIDPRGSVPGLEDKIVENGLDRGVSGVLVKSVPICRSGSLYTRVGDLFAQAIFVLQIIFLMCLLFKKLWDKKVSLR